MRLPSSTNFQPASCKTTAWRSWWKLGAGRAAGRSQLGCHGADPSLRNDAGQNLTDAWADSDPAAAAKWAVGMGLGNSGCGCGERH